MSGAENRGSQPIIPSAILFRGVVIAFLPIAITSIAAGASPLLAKEVLSDLHASHGDFQDRGQHAAFHNNRGLDHYQRGDLDQAIKHLDVAIYLNPVAALPHYNRGNAHLKQRRFDDAIRDYTEALRLHPKFVLAFTNRGNALSALGRLDDALIDFDTAFALEPNNTYVLFNRGYLHGKRKDYEKAIADFTRYISIDAKDADAYLLRASAYIALGETGKAEEDKRKAIELGPSTKKGRP